MAHWELSASYSRPMNVCFDKHFPLESTIIQGLWSTSYARKIPTNDKPKMLWIVSNLISSHLMPDSVPAYPNSGVVQPMRVIENHGNLSLRTEMCQIDFGCKDKVCWRRCHSNTKNQFLWCHTNPHPNAREYYNCDDSADCFLCWECIEPFHEWGKWIVHFITADSLNSVFYFQKQHFQHPMIWIDNFIFISEFYGYFF